LKKALEAYFLQTAFQSIRELIVVDDGSTDNIRLMVEQIGAESPFEIRYFRQEKKGPAAARNLGIREARSELILFTDDDIVPTSTLVAEHLAWHTRNPDLHIAVLGYVTWAPEVKATPFMRWYGECGTLFRYRELQHGAQVDFRFFYTCNVSLKTEFLRARGQFDEEFKLAAFEDTELGYRLEKAGMRLLYNSAAVGYHHQFFSFAEACRKSRAANDAGRLFAQKEAGIHFNDQLGRRESGFARRLARWAAPRVEPAVKPVERLLDSPFPLPRIVYRLFWYYAAHTDKRS
jgi:glycosyltransferase involved in cell wall biosynthesis